ncbi:MAG: hypothetical protein COZ06_08615 [Armatimonadetes bacterium CG_4_10_14_3_um_filter_66_18]|nr:GDYXXLXY domain-containing protein [Armatimonadota bacterium]OIO96453.1 MAG: hypothetical protein AUJ96_24730 [Armatimonadetes bacterium CG2_30_66_41]PIU91425.1 MAG: hypothetical protein COS65_22085 [Armatimonadetes bacterium CG06_land_8_20_14_3_00_66_21]PIW16797.1 MAG: hypothetical protein COW34_05605 [Armatimonadetes bacterium CG17_big_fil_post_rev_8_21_14_2_50_66_6]PIX50167.1 MAG: hypothetical protein COZ57_00295 [Armatimonadetes bacterium CG_4_8_14_3_um_filter_66_20]PIY50585.1 MAG: hypo
MVNRLKFAAAVAVQVAVLTWLMTSRQWTLATGQTILLETVPVDPRSLFQGDYVALGYKISTPAAVGAQGTAGLRPNQTVYVALRQRGKFWEAVSVSRQRPKAAAEEVVLRGTTDYSGQRILYGIESYYVPEGKGLEIERQTWTWSRAPNQPSRVTVEVAVDAAGQAAVRRLLLDGNAVGEK